MPRTAVVQMTEDAVEAKDRRALAGGILGEALRLNRSCTSRPMTRRDMPGGRGSEILAICASDTICCLLAVPVSSQVFANTLLTAVEDKRARTNARTRAHAHAHARAHTHRNTHTCAIAS